MLSSMSCKIPLKTCDCEAPNLFGASSFYPRRELAFTRKAARLSPDRFIFTLQVYLSFASNNTGLWSAAWKS